MPDPCQNGKSPFATRTAKRSAVSAHSSWRLQWTSTAASAVLLRYSKRPLGWAAAAATTAAKVGVVAEAAAARAAARPATTKAAAAEAVAAAAA